MQDKSARTVPAYQAVLHQRRANDSPHVLKRGRRRRRRGGQAPLSSHRTCWLVADGGRDVEGGAAAVADSSSLNEDSRHCFSSA